MDMNEKCAAINTLFVWDEPLRIFSRHLQIRFLSFLSLLFAYFFFDFDQAYGVELDYSNPPHTERTLSLSLHLSLSFHIFSLHTLSLLLSVYWVWDVPVFSLHIRSI